MGRSRIRELLLFFMLCICVSNLRVEAAGTAIKHRDKWVYRNSHWYYYNSDAEILKSWNKIDGAWYYFDEKDGSMLTSWLENANDWYFLSNQKDETEGRLLISWQWIDGYCYYFEEGVNNTGRMYAKEKTPDGYYVDEFGRWVEEDKAVYVKDKGISTKDNKTASNYSLSEESSENSSYNYNPIPNIPEEAEPDVDSSRFDLRNLSGKKFVTGARNQGRHDTCWAFATMAALESHILLKEVDDSVDADSLDLSEDHLARHNGYGYGSNRNGGRYELSISYLLRAEGPYLEVDYPYILDESALQPLPVNPIKLPKEASPVNPKKPYVVKEIKFIEDIDSLKLDEDSIKDSIKPTKEAIVNYGAVSSNIYLSHDSKKRFPYNNESYYNPDKFAYYCDGKDGKYDKQANHAVAIVGWDDNFSKDNFITKPDIDGAWICKDVQGEEFGDKGFYYVSYQSASIATAQHYFTKVEKLRDEELIHQHDALGLTLAVDNNYTEMSENTVGEDTYFNRYKSDDNASLDSIGFYTMGKNADYRLYFIPDFYEFNEKFEGGEDGKTFKEVSEEYLIKSGQIDEAGFNNIELDNSIAISKGQDYAIGLWVNFDSNIKYMPINLKRADTAAHYVFEAKSDKNPKSLKPDIKAGQSYVFDPYSENDGAGIFNGMGDGNSIEDIGYTKKSYGVITFGNLCLKAYLTKESP